MITKRQMGLAMPTALSSGRLELWYPYLVAAMNRCGITTPNRIDYFMANTAEETGELQARQENLHYSAADLRRVFPSLFDDGPLADQIAAGGPEAVGNYVYADANRPPGYRMGNDQPGDGYKYRGRGAMETTGKGNYLHYFARVGLPPDTDPDVLLQPEHGALSAAIYWQDAGCNEIADRGDFTAEVIRINGGTINMATRKLYLGRFVDAMAHPDPVVMAAVVLPPAPKPVETINPPLPDAPPPVTAEELKLPPQLEPVAPLPPVPPPPMEPPPDFEVKANGNIVLSDIKTSTIVKKSRWIEKLGWAGGILTTISGGLQAFKNFFVQLFGGIEVTDTVVVCVTVITLAVLATAVLVARSTGKDRIRMWLQGIA